MDNKNGFRQLPEAIFLLFSFFSYSRFSLCFISQRVRQK